MLNILNTRSKLMRRVSLCETVNASLPSTFITIIIIIHRKQYVVIYNMYYML